MAACTVCLLKRARRIRLGHWLPHVQPRAARLPYTGNAFFFACEHIALSLAIGCVCLKLYRPVYIFGDSEHSLTDILSPTAARCPTLLREWFERNPKHHLYSPLARSLGQEENEAVDVDVKFTARTHVLNLPRDQCDRGRLSTYAYCNPPASLWTNPRHIFRRCF